MLIDNATYVNQITRVTKKDITANSQNSCLSTTFTAPANRFIFLNSIYIKVNEQIILSNYTSDPQTNQIDIKLTTTEHEPGGSHKELPFGKIIISEDESLIRYMHHEIWGCWNLEFHIKNAVFGSGSISVFFMYTDLLEQYN